MRLIVFGIAALLLGAFPAWAASPPSTAEVVTTCNSKSYTAGQVQNTTQNTGGNVCTSASVSATVSVAPLTSTNLSSTISVTNTFQSIQVSTAGRNGCTVQNTSGNGDAMWVFFGAIASATKPISFKLADGQALNCAVGGLGVATDQVSITGTATDTFAANFQ